MRNDITRRDALALGASAGALRTGILMQTLGLAAAGMLLGVAASWALARAIRGLLFGVSDTETGPPPPPVPPLAQLTSKLRPNSMSNNSSFFIHLLHASTHLEESTLRPTKSSHIVTPHGVPHYWRG